MCTNLANVAKTTVAPLPPLKTSTTPPHTHQASYAPVILLTLSPYANRKVSSTVGETK